MPLESTPSLLLVLALPLVLGGGSQGPDPGDDAAGGGDSEPSTTESWVLRPDGDRYAWRLPVLELR